MTGKIYLNSLHDFLSALNGLKVACKHNIYYKCSLSPLAIDRCLEASKAGRLVEGAGGDNRKQNYRLTRDGREMLRMVKRMVRS